jgi:hypothetical protein
MKRIISFLILAVVFALLISCRSTNKCFTEQNKTINPTLTEATLDKIEVA